jgi:CheY-like chemotaxis protein
LIVEDEQALRAVTQRIFTHAGYQVLAAADGHDALALAAGYDGEIHLLVTDVVMPNMLGNEVAERIRLLKPGIAVLCMSGCAQPLLAAQGRACAHRPRPGLERNRSLRCFVERGRPRRGVGHRAAPPNLIRRRPVPAWSARSRDGAARSCSALVRVVIVGGPVGCWPG